MDLEQITTDEDFLTFLGQLSRQAKDYAGTLEGYLCSVLREVSSQQHERPTWRLLAQILADGFSTPPPPFDPTWLQSIKPPEFIIGLHPIRFDPSADVQHLLQMLHYQIADLHRMAEVGTIHDPQRYYGIDSPTGYWWYNFDVATFLACASAGLSSHRREAYECSWDALASTLWLGQLYE